MIKLFKAIGMMFRILFCLPHEDGSRYSVSDAWRIAYNHYFVDWSKTLNLEGWEQPGGGQE